MPKSTWSDELIGELRRLYTTTDMSVSEITAELNKTFPHMTRNTVMGKIARLGLPASRTEQNKGGPHKGSGGPGRGQVPKPRASAIENVQLNKMKVARAAAMRAQQEREASLLPLSEPRLDYNTDSDATLPGKTIHQLNSDTCRWPLGAMLDFPPYRYCGRQTFTSSLPYCANHARLAYAAPAPRKKVTA